MGRTHRTAGVVFTMGGMGAANALVHVGLTLPDLASAGVIGLIAGLLDDHSRRQELGRNAQLAAENFRPELVWRGYATCLNQLAERDIDSNRGMPVVSVTERD